jgi:hypothetical protein
MFYAVLGYLHAALWRANTAVTRRARAIHALAEGERGQGTVEYVGLILLVSLLMVGMVAAMKGFNRNLTKGGHYRVAPTSPRRELLSVSLAFARARSVVGGGRGGPAAAPSQRLVPMSC